MSRGTRMRGRICSRARVRDCLGRSVMNLQSPARMRRHSVHRSRMNQYCRVRQIDGWERRSLQKAGVDGRVDGRAFWGSPS